MQGYDMFLGRRNQLEVSRLKKWVYAAIPNQNELQAKNSMQEIVILWLQNYG